MSSSVEVFVKYPGGLEELAGEIATTLGVRGFFDSGEGCTCGVGAEPWIDTSGWASLSLDPTDLATVGDLGPFEDTAFAPYEYELSIEFRGASGMTRGELTERIGRALFDGLTAMGYPLAFGQGANSIFADYLPDRGLREFPADTDMEEPGRDHWFEPRLHADPYAAWPRPAMPAESRERRRVQIFEADGLLQIIPTAHGRTTGWQPVAPTASLRPATLGSARLGTLLHQAIRRSGTARTGGADPYSWVLDISQQSADEYSRSAAAVTLELDDDKLTATPHARYAGETVETVTTGPVIDDWCHRGTFEASHGLAVTIQALLDAAHRHSSGSTDRAN